MAARILLTLAAAFLLSLHADARSVLQAPGTAPAEAPADAPAAESPSNVPSDTPSPAPVAPEARSFVISNDQFLKNGKPIQIISGSVHYFRIRPEQWEDRLLRAKSLGLNTISTYVPWSLHEASPKAFYFQGDADFEAFLSLANSLDLMILLRLGPYICGEYDLGGLPSWLLNMDPKVEIRSEDPAFLAQVDAWWDVLLPRVQPLLWANGGPVVMVQVENEYGYYATEMGSKVNTTAYLTHLVNKTQSILGNDTIIYTTDNAVAAYVGNGTLNGSSVFTTIDAFPGADYDAAFALQKLYNAPGMSPPMTSEFYLGWFTNWGEAVPVPDAAVVATALDHILSLNASINFYMAVGGTNFNFTSGANTGAVKDQYHPQVTSYDYAAPIGEGGDISSPLFEVVRSAIANHTNTTLPAAPELPPRAALASFNLTESVSLFDALDLLSTPVPAVWPNKMEYFNQSSGLILYTATLPAFSPVDALTIFGVKDRAKVYITTPAVPATPLVPSGTGTAPVRRFIGVTERWAPKLKMPLAPAAPVAGDQVQILVEDMGRVNFGKFMQDETKGVGVVMMGFMPIFHWTVNPIPLNNLSAVPFQPIADSPTATFVPTFYRGSFHVGKRVDTFLSLKGWTKGIAFINGFNLGRYWPAAGPQCHLYIPGSLLKKGTNSLILLELDAAPGTLEISFTNTTDFSCTPVPLVPPTPALLNPGQSAASASM